MEVTLIALLTVGFLSAHNAPGQDARVVKPVRVQETSGSRHTSVEGLRGQDGEAGCPVGPKKVGDDEVGVVPKAKVELGKLYVLGVEEGRDSSFSQDCCFFPQNMGTSLQSRVREAWSSSTRAGVHTYQRWRR